MQTNDLEKIAYEACFATDYTIKSNGEQYFFTLVQRISMDQLYQLMNNYSSTVLFLLMEYLHKTLFSHPEPKGLFMVLNQSVSQWFNNTAALIRKDRKQLQSYIEKSVGRTLGYCLKVIYFKNQSREWVKKTVSEITNPRFKLYTWINFMEQVSTIDRDITFLEYRSMVYSFQQMIIPSIMDNLLPFFQSVKQQIQINQLSSNMQSTLSLSSHGLEPSHVLVLAPQDSKFTEIVFSVLKQIICFNYNITYSEYQSQTPIENCLICFPDSITKKIVSRQFIISIFYVVEKLAYQQRQFVNSSQFDNNGNIPMQRQSSNSGQSLNARFLAISLECLTKISLTKMTYVSYKLKQQFIKHMVKGINRLLSINLAALDTKQGVLFRQQSISSLLELNNKLLINIQLFEIRKFEVQFMEWITNIRQTIIKMVLINTEISVDNTLLLESLQLTVKIISEAVSTQLKSEQNKFRQFGLEIFSIFINTFLGKQQNLLGSNPGTKIKNFDEMKKNTVLFKKIRSLLTLDLMVTLPLLDNAITQLLKSNETPVNTIANIFFCIGDFCELGIFDRNILYDDPRKQMFPKFGAIIVLLLQWIIYYRGTDNVIQIIQVSILLFIEKLLSEVLSLFSYEQKVLQLNNRLFQCIKQSQSTSLSQSRLMQGEHFLYFCFNQLTLSLSTGGYQRVSYTFDVLGTLILKFKWGIKRQSFKETQIAKTVLNLCLNLSNNNLEGELIKLRKKLFKIITNICFDDILDDYHENIDKLVSGLEVTMKQNRWKVLYDLTGICEAIDIPTIYRYFIITLTKRIPLNSLMDQFFNNCDSKIQILAEILKLHLAMIQNKSHKLSGVKGVRINYMLLQNLIGYWILILEQAVSDDTYEEVLSLLYQIVYSMIKGHHVNFFQLQRICQNYKLFIKNVIKNMIGVSSWVPMYPQLNHWYRLVLEQISQQLLPIIMCSADQQLIMCFNSLLQQCLTSTAIQLEQLKSIEQPTQNIEKSLQHSIDTIDNIFKYLRDARKLTHKHIQVRNIEEGILKVNFDIKFQFLIQLFGFGIDSKKNRVKYIDKFCAIIQHMDFMCFGTFDQLVSYLGLPPKRVQSLKEIWGLVEKDRSNEENQQQFLLRIKQWFRGCDSDSMIEPESY